MSNTPPPNFAPKVIFIDESAAPVQSLSASSSSASVVDEKYPASSFHPKVTYIDDNLSRQEQAPQTIVVDEKYPAANFQSKVIYSDESAVTSVATAEQSSVHEDPKYPGCLL